MIDYVKLQLVGVDIEYLKNLEVLEFKTVVSEKTGVIAQKTVAEYHFCKVSIYASGKVLFTGSVHKLFNSLQGIKAPNYRESCYKGFNGNLFTLKDFCFVRNHLSDLFNCSSDKMIIQNIEFGVNAHVNFNPNKFIKGLLYHQGKEFEYRFDGSFAQVIHQRFFMKIYNKSKQYGMSDNILRIEIKVKKACELKGLGLSSLGDISKESLKRANKLLIGRFNEIVYFDYTINKNALNGVQIKSLGNYSNPRFWIDQLKPNHRHRPKAKLRNIIKNYSQNLHSYIEKEITKKCVIINRTF